MKRVKETNFTTRVYQYGVVPLDAFPKEGIDELFKANHLRNKLVDLTRKSREKYQQARCKANGEYASLSYKATSLTNLFGLMESKKNNIIL